MEDINTLKTSVKNQITRIERLLSDYKELQIKIDAEYTSTEIEKQLINQLVLMTQEALTGQETLLIATMLLDMKNV